MKILLIKPETVGIFALTHLVDHEPLELEYLYTVLSKQGHEAFIYDRRHDMTSLKKKLYQVRPDVVCITGYITQEPLMIRLTHLVKKYDATIKVVIGGSHAEINYKNFYVSDADYIYHLSGLKNFALLMDYESGNHAKVKIEEIPGICYLSDGQWIFHEKEVESPKDLPIPDRTYFYAHERRFRYLTYHPLALIKNAYSCPHACTFCYCTNRNSGIYECRSVESLVDEIETLKVPHIHITDDNFLTNRTYLKAFVALIRSRNIQKKFLIYGRADFIANNEDLIGELAEIGLSLVMVGLEATDDEALDSYQKKTTTWHNEECVRILHKYHVICAGLFIVHQEMEKKDFKALYQWIAARPIIPTLSILTPMQGAVNYKEYEEQLLTRDIRKQDLFHCILKPKYMNVWQFTLAYYKLSLGLAFKNRHAPLYACIGISSFVFLLKVLLVKLKRLFVF